MKKKEEGNIFWAVYNAKGKVISISKDKTDAKQEALKLSKRRWTYQTFDKEWSYLEKDGYNIYKSIIMRYAIIK